MNKEENIVKEAIQILDDLRKLLDDRVEDLYQVKGGMQARHAYMFYREKVWEAIDKLKSVKQQEQ
jgi:hypothetical protein